MRYALPCTNDRGRDARTLEIWRERIGRMGSAHAIRVGESLLPSVRAIEPAQQVIERAVLHHHDDDVVDPRALRQRQRGALRDRALGLGPASAQTPAVAAALVRNCLRDVDRG